MGKQRIEALLGQLQDNHQQDIHNSAAIFSVAQVAVNQLDQRGQTHQYDSVLAIEPKEGITKETLLQKYHNYAGCRRAAKNQGITFKKTPSWAKLVCAFTYAEAMQQLSATYVATHSNPDLTGIKFELQL